MTSWDADLRLAHLLADRADEVTTARFRAGDLVVDRKPDLTPVTDADRHAEQVMRRSLERERPADAIVGEEYGVSGDSPRRWVMDPIDGTKNYVRGVPVWATLVALQQDARTVVGVVSAPALGRRWWAAAGGGAFTGTSRTDARPCRVSGVAALPEAYLSFASLPGWEEHGRLPQFLDLLRTVWRTRAFGDFWSHMMVAEGAVDVSCEPEVSLWDLAALEVVVTEAGGRFTDLSGADRADGGSVVCSNGLLHDEVLQRLGAPAPTG